MNSLSLMLSTASVRKYSAGIGLQKSFQYTAPSKTGNFYPMNYKDDRPWYKSPALTLSWTLVFSLLLGLIVLAFPIPDYDLSLSRDTVNIPQGGDEILLLSVSFKHGYNELISIDPNINQDGINIHFSKATIKNGGHARLMIKVEEDALISSRTIKLRTLSDSNRSKSITLNINIKPASWQPLDQQKGNDDVLREFAWKESINIIPYEEQSYADIFGGVSDATFYAYNAPWKIEGNKHSASWRESLEVHKKRYLSNVRAKYLFFDTASLKRARRFWTDLQAITDVDLQNTIEAKLLEGNDTKEPIYFSWDSGATVDVLYPDPFLMHGKPHLVFQAIGNEQMHALLRHRFDEKWD